MFHTNRWHSDATAGGIQGLGKQLLPVGGPGHRAVPELGAVGTERTQQLWGIQRLHRPQRRHRQAADCGLPGGRRDQPAPLCLPGRPVRGDTAGWEGKGPRVCARSTCEGRHCWVGREGKGRGRRCLPGPPVRRDTAGCEGKGPRV